ncbi:MAG TPA: hypothetical protein PLV92_10445, partial [Pirellulaceae bacterium]|nr:hypothetical protein [Pirellulaceae bacterium]
MPQRVVGRARLACLDIVRAVLALTCTLGVAALANNFAAAEEQAPRATPSQGSNEFDEAVDDAPDELLGPPVAIYDAPLREFPDGIEWVNLQQPLPPITPPLELAPRLPTAASELADRVFADPSLRRSLVNDSRRRSLTGVGEEVVVGGEGKFRATTDGGNLLWQSLSAPGVKAQQRTPITTDPRVRGSRSGRTLASGSYWAPARDDLDTMLSKIDSRLIQNVVVIQGPYAARYGPGFDFIDFQLLESPRYEDGGPHAEGSSSVEYKTNGQQWYGRQSFWGGGANYGFRVSYGHRTGNDYETGGGWELPSSYNSRDLNVAFGYDFSPDSHLEFNYLRLDQTGVEFPGLVFDINYLVTDGFELKYALDDQPEFDRLTLEGWYNRTRFAGDTSRPGKNRQIPTLRTVFGLTPDQYLTTDVDGMSAGYRGAVTWGGEGEATLTVGTDLIRQGQQLNDIVPAHDEEVLPGFTVPVPQ